MTKTLLASILFASSLSFAQVPGGAPPKMPDAGTDAAQGLNKGKALAHEAEQKAVVHINSASPEELAKLPGIGPAKAKAIVAARPFKSIEDLKNVKGIKEGVFNKIKGMVAL